MKKFKEISKSKDEAVSNQDFSKAAQSKIKEDELRLKISMKDSIQKIFSNVVVTPEDIAIVIAPWTSVPVTKITKTEAANLLQMKDEMNDKVVGQSEAINAICSAMRRARAGIRSPRRPIFYGVLQGRRPLFNVD